MKEDENTFPMDFYVQDSSPRPWEFKPEGYLVVILSDTDEAQRAVADLVTHGFAPRDVRGHEGPAESPRIDYIRKRMKRNLMATLVFPRGVRMILGGDEIGRTQLGNNNAYSQDNEIS
jgi:hypothetical protein